MNIKTILGIIAVLIVGAAAYYFLTPKQPAMQAKTMGNKMNDSIESFSGTISELLAKNTPLQCDFTYSDKDAGGTSSGTVYVSGNKMRGNFETAIQDKTTQTSMIRRDNEVYTWGFEQGVGYKMQFDESMMQNAKDKAEEYMPQSKNESSFDPNKQKVDYNCRAWAGDESMFTPPADIKFQDLSGMMQQMQKMNSETQNSMDREKACAACDSAPEEARASCRQALGCK